MIQHTSIRLANSIKDNKARFLVSDFNLAMPMVVQSLRACGVDCVLLEYHVELATTQNEKGVLSILKDSDGNTSLLFDTVGIWSLGPMGVYGCSSSSVWSHILGGLTHPFPEKKGQNSRGFSNKAHWKGELSYTGQLTEKAVEVCMRIIDILKLFNGDQQQVIEWERNELPDFLRACGMEMPNDRERRGEGVGFGDIHQPGLRVWRYTHQRVSFEPFGLHVGLSGMF